jgi:hypothetical protein
MYRAIMRRWLPPIVFLMLLVIAFGLLIPELGFYWDDWPVVFLGKTQGTSEYVEFYKYDRPFSAWTYILTIPILGVQPLKWHIFTLGLRWLTVLGMWWMLKGVWPQRKNAVIWMALLFSIYPIFFQQSIAVAYSQHFLTYGLCILSLGAMVWAYRAERRFWILTGIAVVSMPVHLLTMEYFIGLEFLRPILLWIIIRERVKDPRKLSTKVIKAWAPYLLILVGFMVWRLFFLHIPDDPNAPRLLWALQADSLQALIALVQNVARDFLYISVTSWFQTLDPSLINLTDRFLMFSWFMAAVTACGLILLMHKTSFVEPELEEPTGCWVCQGIILGIAAIMSGMFPVWFTGRDLLKGLYSDRFGLAAMLGASILLVSLTTFFSRQRLQRVILLSVLVGLSVGTHLRVANEYRWDWTIQRRFYWQLFWRAPGLEAGTAIVVDGSVSGRVAGYVAATAVNTLYPQDSSRNGQTYWFFGLFQGLHNDSQAYLDGLRLRELLRTLEFDGRSEDSLLLFHDPQSRCLWVLDKRQEMNLVIKPVTREFLKGSNLALIQPQPSEVGYPPEDVFGRELEHTWCYYYEKAELERQQEDWQEIVDLKNEADTFGYEPNDSAELLPFIEAYVALGEWKKAQDLSIQMYKRNFKTQALVCDIWEKSKIELFPDEGFETAESEVKAVVGCP